MEKPTSTPSKGRYKERRSTRLPVLATHRASEDSRRDNSVSSPAWRTLPSSNLSPSGEGLTHKPYRRSPSR